MPPPLTRRHPALRRHSAPPLNYKKKQLQVLERERKPGPSLPGELMPGCIAAKRSVATIELHDAIADGCWGARVCTAALVDPVVRSSHS